MARDKEALDSVRAIITNILGFESERLLTRPEWGNFDLEPARDDLTRIYEIVNYLSALPMEYLTDRTIKDIRDKLDQIHNHFNAINAFSITSSPTPLPQQSQNFVTQMGKHADELFTASAPWIPFLAYQKGDVSQNIKTLASKVTEGEILLQGAKESVEKKGKEIDEIVTKAREASATAGAAVFTADFNKAAGKLKDNASSWLWITGILAFATLFSAGFFWFSPRHGLDQAQIWQTITTKMVFLGTLLTATIWCGKIYKALMHQSTVYQHRALSIQTVQAFSASADDTQIKDAIVHEAAKAIFSVGSTGYIDQTQDGGDGAIKIMEVARKAIPGK